MPLFATSYPKRGHGIEIDVRRQNTLENNSSTAQETVIPRENTVFDAVESHWRNDVCFSKQPFNQRSHKRAT